MPAYKITKVQKVEHLIKAAIAEQGLNQEKVARHFKVHRTTVNKWIKNYELMQVGQFEAMCTYLHIDPMSIHNAS